MTDPSMMKAIIDKYGYGAKIERSPSQKLAKSRTDTVRKTYQILVWDGTGLYYHDDAFDGTLEDAKQFVRDSVGGNPDYWGSVLDSEGNAIFDCAGNEEKTWKSRGNVEKGRGDTLGNLASMVSLDNEKNGYNMVYSDLYHLLNKVSSQISELDFKFKALQDDDINLAESVVLMDYERRLWDAYNQMESGRLDFLRAWVELSREVESIQRSE